MADNLAPALPQEPPTSPQAGPTGASSSFPAGTSANHGYTSAQYVSRHRASTQVAGSSPHQGPYASQQQQQQPLARSPVKPTQPSLQQPLSQYAQPSLQQHQLASPVTHGPSQGFVAPPPQRPPVLSSPVQSGPPTSLPYPQQGIPPGPAADPYSSRFSTQGPPRPAPPMLGGPGRPNGPSMRPPGGPGPYYGSPPIRPVSSQGPGYPGDYPARGQVRPAPPAPSYALRQDGPMGNGGHGGMGPGSGPGPGPGPGMGHRPPMRPPPQQQSGGYPIANQFSSNPRFSTQSLPGWDHEKSFNGPAAHHPNIRPPPASWNDAGSQNGGGAITHRRAASNQIQPTYYGNDHQTADRQASGASRYNNGPYPPNISPAYQQSGPYPSSPNRQLVRHQLSDAPISPTPRLHNGQMAFPEGHYQTNSPFRKLSISEHLDNGRISLDSTASIESGYSNRQPALYPAPNMYSRDSDPGMEAFPPNRQRSASKSSTYSGHSVASDYYADFDSISVPRSTTPNGSATPQISIQSAQGFPPGRADPFSLRARTPSPGRARQGSNPPLANRAGIVILIWLQDDLLQSRHIFSKSICS
jgi:hypothetical protein